MKQKQFLFTAAMCLTGVLGFTSCDDDNDNGALAPAATPTIVATTSNITEDMAIGDKLILSVEASTTDGGTLTYTWQESSDNGGSWKNIPQAISVEYTKTLTAEDLQGKMFRCDIWNVKEGYSAVSVKTEPFLLAVDEYTTGVYVLNSGKFGSNNSTLTFYDVNDGTVTPNYFRAQNGRQLGDTGQDMVVYGSKTYIAVYASNVIEVIDRNGVSLASIQPQDAGGQPQSPRYLTKAGGNVYVTLFDGHVAKIDTTTLAITAQVAVGRNPEQIAVSNNKLFVANSGGLGWNDPNLGYDKTVSVIDIATFSVVKTVQVVLNPTEVTTDAQGDVYVISMGDYGAIPNTMQRIDPNTYEVTTVGNATKMASAGDKIYVYYSQYDTFWNQVITFYEYDAVAETMGTTSFITDGTVVEQPCSLSVDPLTGDIYVGTSDYTNNGDMYVFSADGKLKNRFGVGLNPMGAYFLTNK